MSDDDAQIEEPEGAQPLKARETLAKRLADIVCLPASRITPQERQIAADLLVDMLRESPADIRQRCAQRIAKLPEAPGSVLRWLGVDEARISEPVISGSEALSDADLAAIARAGGPEQRMQIASRLSVSPLVTEFLVEREEAHVIEKLLANRGAEISDAAIDTIVRLSRDNHQFVRALAIRNEVKPSQGLTMFWWADAETRKQLLLRFGVERHLLQDAAGDVFSMAAATGWSDSVTRKALQFIERRQRNRLALERSEFPDLETALKSVSQAGLNRRMAEEVSYLCGLKPATGAKILSDIGGEPIAVLCKGTGLRREALDDLWSSLKRPTSAEGGVDPAYDHVIDVYESLATDKAQTILRYWNWSLTSAMSPSLARAITDEEAMAEGSMSAAYRSSRLVWGEMARGG